MGKRIQGGVQGGRRNINKGSQERITEAAKAIDIALQDLEAKNETGHAGPIKKWINSHNEENEAYNREVRAERGE